MGKPQGDGDTQTLPNGKKLFELIAVKGDGDKKTLGASACTWARGLAFSLAPTSHLVKLSLPNI